MSNSLNNIINELKVLSLMDLLNLITEIEKIFNINSTIINNNNLNIVDDKKDIKTEIEKTEFDLILDNINQDKKISILKLVRNITGLGLKESKDIVDNLPHILKEKVLKNEAEKIKKEFELVGANIIIK
jgi:large subunit ribosomal protein L7/L12